MYITVGWLGSTVIEFCAALPAAHVASAAFAGAVDATTEMPTIIERVRSTDTPREMDFFRGVRNEGELFIAIFRWSGRAPCALIVTLTRGEGEVGVMF